MPSYHARGYAEERNETVLRGLVGEGSRPLGLVGDAREECPNAGPICCCWACSILGQLDA